MPSDKPVVRYASAEISPCGGYRYHLRRVLGESTPATLNVCLWIMLNPSTADALEDDPTIRRIVGFTHRWGFNCCDVVNIYGWRSPNPMALNFAADPVGADNAIWHERALESASRVVFAWGNHADHKVVGPVIERVRQSRRETVHLGMTRNWQPKHPLYLKADTKPVPWEFVA